MSFDDSLTMADTLIKTLTNMVHDITIGLKPAGCTIEDLNQQAVGYCKYKLLFLHLSCNS